jgi:GNAT superfamily N-acetyltransferase
MMPRRDASWSPPIRLRVLGLGGSPEFVKLMSADGARETLRIPFDATAAALCDWYARYTIRRLAGREALYAIARGPEDLGFAGAYHTGVPTAPRIGYIYYFLDERHRGRGYGRAAVRALLERAARDLHVEVVRAVAKSSNLISRRVLTANGFRQVAAPGIGPDDAASPDREILYEFSASSTGGTSPT